MESLADAPAASVLAADAQWIEHLITGSLTATLAIIAVALVGFAMFGGRLPVRRGATVLIGCFVLFGAPAIAHGLLSFVLSDAGLPIAANTAPGVQIPPNLPQQPQSANPFDPYAGAAVPTKP